MKVLLTINIVLILVLGAITLAHQDLNPYDDSVAMEPNLNA